MSNNKYILAIDLGTSGPKVALVSVQGQVIASEIEQTQLLLLANGGAEQKPDDWWQSIKQATHKLLAKKLVSVNDIIAISCTAQWSGTVAVDKNGKALMNAIIWMDSRGAPYVQAITNGFPKIEGYGAGKLLTWLRLTGGIPGRAGKDSIAHILYIKAKYPDIYRQTYKFLEPKDYLNLRLTGQFAASYDSIALHWVTDNRNINHIKYHPKLLKMATLNPEQLPDLKQAIDILGPLTADAAKELMLNPGIKVVTGTPDLQSAAVGSGAVRDYEAHLYIGTSSWLTCHIPFKKVDIFHNMTSLPSAIPGRYFIANEQESAGVCLSFLKNNIFYPQDELETGQAPTNIYHRFDRLAEQAPPGSGKLIFTPWLNGERTPVEDHQVRGGFYNLSLQNNRQHLLRAVLEGVAYNTRWLLNCIEKFNGRPFEAINFIGGGANSAIWSQILADVLNRPLKQVKDPIQANARGAAFLAAVALGETTFNDISKTIKIENTYQPNPKNQLIYNQLFKEFIAIYKRNKKFHKALNSE